MARIDKQQILNKTHHGTGIYAHILRRYYPDEVVMHISGRDCGLCRNPFTGGSNTLHVWIHKTDPGNSLSPEYAVHHDNSGTIPDGDAFDFAALHYKQSGDELLATINNQLNLHIGEPSRWYNRANNACHTKNNTEKNSNANLFSFFKSPITNTKPYKAISPGDAYNYIVGDIAKERTERLRHLLADTLHETSRQQNPRVFKATNFDYCTFSGIFQSRSDKALIRHSGLLCVDFDHLNSVETLFKRLLNDEYFDTQLLFRSPSGDGLKWIIKIDISHYSHSEWFRAVAKYISQTYNVEVDKSGKDISRACFLPHDPQAFINPLYKLSLQAKRQKNADNNFITFN